MRRGEFNEAVIILGLPGTGKSTYAVERLIEYGKRPAYKLVHDPGWRVPERTYKGIDAKFIRHNDITSAAKGILTKPGHTHAIASEDGDDVLALAERIASTSLDKHGGMEGTPTIVLLDEGVATSGASPYRISPGMRRFLAGRRHKHVGLIMTAQDPSYIHYSMVGLCTELVTFRLRDTGALKKLTRMGVSDIERIPSLGTGEYVVHKLG